VNANESGKLSIPGVTRLNVAVAGDTSIAASSVTLTYISTSSAAASAIAGNNSKMNNKDPIITFLLNFYINYLN